MRLIVTENISLDGVVEQNEQTGEWFSVANGDADTSDVEEVLRQMMRDESAQLHGRRTFQAMRGFWPHQTHDTTGVTKHLNEVDKYVISTTMTDPEWENSTVLRGQLINEVGKLKERPGRNLGVTGSISVCRSLIDAGLVDEYRLLLYPVVVSTGRRLFDDGGIETRRLRLLESTAFESGIVLLRYEPA